MKNVHDSRSSIVFSDRGLFMFFRLKGMLENLRHFTIAGGWLEIALKYWSLQRYEGDLATMRCDGLIFR